MSAYADALARGRRDGASRCDDAALMAGLLDSAGQILIGAVSPELVWDGARARGLTTAELNRLIHDDPDGAADLMFVTDTR